MKRAVEMQHIRELLAHADMPAAARKWLFQRWFKLFAASFEWPKQ